MGLNRRTNGALLLDFGFPVFRRIDVDKTMSDCNYEQTRSTSGVIQQLSAYGKCTSHVLQIRVLLLKNSLLQYSSVDGSKT
jgi:hypothetical protein